MKLKLVIGSNTSETVLNDLRRMSKRQLEYDTKLAEICHDSLALQDLMIEIEDHYDIILNMKETTELVTVSDLVEVIEDKLDRG